MPAIKAKKVVSTVKRGPRPAIATVRAKAVPKKQDTVLKAKAKASRKAAVAPLLRKKPPATVITPVIEREEPHILKSTEGKPLVERLNDKLLEQLRSRKVTNEAVAEALGIHPTYLSRTLREMGFEKVKGATMAHREARSELADAREKFRAQLAKEVNRNKKTVEAAAKEAKCTVRTMFRWCAKYANVR